MNDRVASDCHDSQKPQINSEYPCMSVMCYTELPDNDANVLSISIQFTVLKNRLGTSFLFYNAP